MPQLLSPWRTCLAAAALLTLASCGGETLALLGFIGAAGGDWLQDDKPDEAVGQVGLQLRSTCRLPGDPLAPLTEDCFINIQPVGGESLYGTDFDLSFSSNLPGCPDTGTGRATGRRLALTGCFTGEYVTINQALSDDRLIRMFFNFTPDMTQGVWTEIQSGQRRFAFINNSSGCELGSPAIPVSIVIEQSDITNATGPFETTISSFAVQGGGAPWQGRFVGVSGMRLTRGGETLELERRDSNVTCP